MSDFKGMKFDCKDMSQEERANLQMNLFNLGYQWFGDGPTIKHTDTPYIYTYTGGDICYGRNYEDFEKHRFVEYTLVDGELVKVGDSVTQHTDDFAHTKTFEGKMEYIDLTYAEAWQALKDGKEVLYNGMACHISCVSFGLIDYAQPNVQKLVPYHPTDKLFKMKKEPEFESLGLSDDCVEIDVFGLKAYHKFFPQTYFVDSQGYVLNTINDMLLGKIKYKGDYTKARITVTVDKDGNITYEDVA